MKDSSLCNSYKLPRTYNVYHLNGKQINIDGRLDDEAWQEVSWSEKFVDMRSELYPAPHLDTKIKIRYCRFVDIIAELIFFLNIMFEKKGK